MSGTIIVNGENIRILSIMILSIIWLFIFNLETTDKDNKGSWVKCIYSVDTKHFLWENLKDLWTWQSLTKQIGQVLILKLITTQTQIAVKSIYMVITLRPFAMKLEQLRLTPVVIKQTLQRVVLMLY